jgi:hypothetical protein
MILSVSGNTSRVPVWPIMTLVMLVILRQGITEVFDEINSDMQSDLTLRFRDPLSKDLLKVA